MTNAPFPEMPNNDEDFINALDLAIVLQMEREEHASKIEHLEARIEFLENEKAKEVRSVGKCLESSCSQ